jgi:hypothetical protein
MPENKRQIEMAENILIGFKNRTQPFGGGAGVFFEETYNIITCLINSIKEIEYKIRPRIPEYYFDKDGIIHHIKCDEKDEFYEFNINNEIHVKLTDKGYEHWYKFINQDIYPKSTHKTLKNLYEKTDKDGFVRFTTWEFIQIFGDITHISADYLETTHVRFKKIDLQEVE